MSILPPKVYCKCPECGAITLAQDMGKKIQVFEHLEDRQGEKCSGSGELISKEHIIDPLHS